FDEEEVWKQLLPFTFTKPVSELRLGIFTLREKWELHLEETCSSLSKDYLKAKYPAELTADNFFINSKVLPDRNLVEAIMEMGKDSALMGQSELLAFRSSTFDPQAATNFKQIHYSGEYHSIHRVWEFFQKCGQAIVS